MSDIAQGARRVLRVPADILYRPVGTRCLNASNQLKTMLIRYLAAPCAVSALPNGTNMVR